MKTVWVHQSDNKSEENTKWAEDLSLLGLEWGGSGACFPTEKDPDCSTCTTVKELGFSKYFHFTQSLQNSHPDSETISQFQVSVDHRKASVFPGYFLEDNFKGSQFFPPKVLMFNWLELGCLMIIKKFAQDLIKIYEVKPLNVE